MGVSLLKMLSNSMDNQHSVQPVSTMSREVVIDFTVPHKS